MYLTNTDDHKNNYKKIFKELLKEPFDEINQKYLTCYFRDATAAKIFDDFQNHRELSEKIKSGEMKL